LGWRTRSPDLRQRLIKSLSTDDFDQAYHAWINVEIGTEKVLADLRLERDTFMRELSAAGAVETSPSVFYDIAHDVEVWRLQPEWFQAREALRARPQTSESMLPQTARKGMMGIHSEESIDIASVHDSRRASSSRTQAISADCPCSE
jgi:hypothetical protein